MKSRSRWTTREVEADGTESDGAVAAERRSECTAPAVEGVASNGSSGW